MDSCEELSSQRARVHKILQVDGKATIVISHHLMLLFRRKSLMLSKTTLAFDFDQTTIFALGGNSYAESSY